jgi:hypothetical protein
MSLAYRTLPGATIRNTDHTSAGFHHEVSK